MEALYDIISQFGIPKEETEITPLTSGLINHTYYVKTPGENPDYILQSKNKNVFPDIPSMMNNIVKVTSHLKQKIKEKGGDPDREAMTIINTKDGLPYYKDPEGEYWTMCLFINDTISYDVADNPELARKAGEGIGKFQSQLSDLNQPLQTVIEGFHDLGYRFKQWDRALVSGNKERIEKVSKEVEWVEKRRQEMERFWKLVEDGTLPKRVTHNDTKLSNILFDKNGEVLCVIDLDTVMSNTPLADYGDAIRSFANTGKEDEPDLDKIDFDIQKYQAYTEGYLSYAKEMLNDQEVKYLPFAPLYITYEQVMRFLMDYIQDDQYYKIDYPEHNLIRTRAQMKLMERMEDYLV